MQHCHNVVHSIAYLIQRWCNISNSNTIKFIQQSIA